jgi:hypothetical protein
MRAACGMPCPSLRPLTTHLLPLLDNSHHVPTVLAAVTRVTVGFLCSPRIMAQDITRDFRDLVEQKGKDPGEARRTKLGRKSHITPGDTHVDGAPPFMQAYMKEAHTIVSHVLLLFTLLTRDGKLQQVALLTRMLAAVRRAYLDVHARIPPVTRHVGRALDTTYMDTWIDIKYFTNAERNQIDVQAQNILARCAHHVHDMETMEKRAPPLSSPPLPIPYRIAEPAHRSRGARRSSF